MSSTVHYGVHPGFARLEQAHRELPSRTGKTMADWVGILAREGPTAAHDQRTWLQERGVTSNQAMWIVEEAAGRVLAAYDPRKLVNAQYAGKKAALKPIYDALLYLGLSMGSDVRACPCATMVPLFRKHVFAQIKPTTLTRVDLGLCLRGVAPHGRLVATGGEQKRDRITHRISITSPGEIDREVRDWLRRAYEACP